MLAPLRTPGPGVIKGSYLVILRDDASSSDSARVERLARAHGGRVTTRYRAALLGFGADLPAAALAAVRGDPDVDHVSRDQRVKAS